MMPLQTDADLEVFLFRLAYRSEHFADARCIGGDRFFHEDMLASIDCCLEVNRPKTGRRRQNDHIDVAVDDLPVGVESA